RGHNDATGLANIRVDSGFRVSFVHHSPPNPPASPNPPRKNRLPWHERTTRLTSEATLTPEAIGAGWAAGSGAVLRGRERIRRGVVAAGSGAVLRGRGGIRRGVVAAGSGAAWSEGAEGVGEGFGEAVDVGAGEGQRGADLEGAAVRAGRADQDA